MCATPAGAVGRKVMATGADVKIQEVWSSLIGAVISRWRRRARLAAIVVPRARQPAGALVELGGARRRRSRGAAPSGDGASSGRKMRPGSKLTPWRVAISRSARSSPGSSRLEEQREAAFGLVAAPAGQMAAHGAHEALGARTIEAARARPSRASKSSPSRNSASTVCPRLDACRSLACLSSSARSRHAGGGTSQPTRSPGHSVLEKLPMCHTRRASSARSGRGDACRRSAARRRRRPRGPGGRGRGARGAPASASGGCADCRSPAWRRTARTPPSQPARGRPPRVRNRSSAAG